MKECVHFLSFFFLLLGFSFSLGYSGNLKVGPIQIFLSTDSPSAILSLKNDSREMQRVQLRVYSWDESIDGRMLLKPTGDILFFPKLLQLSGEEERKVRIGPLVPFSAVEKTYRIFVEELPPLEKPEARPTPNVRVLTRMGLPIFLQPYQKKVQAKITNINLAYGIFSFEIKNEGNVHLEIQRIVLSGMSKGGKKVFEQPIQGWYLLAGGTRRYEVKISKTDCQKLSVMLVELKALELQSQERFILPKTACTGF